MIGYLDKVIKALVLILLKISVYFKTFKNKDGDKNKKNKLMPLRINVDKLLVKNKTISTNIEDLKNIELNDLPGYDNRYIKTKIRSYGNKVYPNFP